jgi:RNase P subunit RPR2
MIKCEKCKKRMFIDRVYSDLNHLEVFCLCCGSRKFYNPPSSSSEGAWLQQKEKILAKNIINRRS